MNLKKKNTGKIDTKFPKELEGIVEKKDIKYFARGEVVKREYEENGEKKDSYILSVKADIWDVRVLTVSEEFVKQRNLKDGDKIAYVEYSLGNRRMIDVFKSH